MSISTIVPFFKGVGLTLIDEDTNSILMMSKKGEKVMDVFAGKIETGKNGFVDFDSIFGAVREFNEETMYSAYFYLSGKTMEDYKGKIGTLCLIADSQEFFENKIRNNTKLLRLLPEDITKYNQNYIVHKNLLVAFGLYVIKGYIPIEKFSGILDNGNEYNVYWIPINDLEKYVTHPRLKMIKFVEKLKKLYGNVANRGCRSCRLWIPLQNPQNFVHVNADGSVFTRYQEGWNVTTKGYSSLENFDNGRWNNMTSYSVQSQEPYNADFD